MSTFSIKTVVVEEVGAWEECRLTTDHASHDIQDCLSCQGAGGAWHSLIKDDPSLGLMLNTQGEIWFPFNGSESTILIREWALCTRCGGKGFKPAHCSDCEGPCKHCKGTGCEPGTQGGWEVKG